MRKIFIGIAWPYANGSLHLGHVAGALLPGDIFAKYNRLREREVVMVSGSDEHGTPITITAEIENKTPKEIVDYYHNEHKVCLQKLHIDFEYFSRSSSEQHKKIVTHVFLKLLENNYIYEKECDEFYCSNCNKYLPDRYIEGICPHCKYSSARGDQCPNCKRLYSSIELLDVRCKICKNVPETKKTTHLYFKLTALKDRLMNYLKDKNYWKRNVYDFTMHWLENIQDRAITRNINWGVEVPLKNYADKRLYVWFEAVIGYLSASIAYTKTWDSIWYDKDTEHYYFIGKDNIPFHTIIWPGIEIAYDENMVLPKNIPANEYLTLGKEAFSKSKKIGYFVLDYLNKYETCAIRYYLSMVMPETKDVEFVEEDFVSKVNNELVGILGNFIHRILSFAYNNFEEICSDMEDNEVTKIITASYNEYENYLETCEFKNGLKVVMNLAKFGNQYIVREAPWNTIKTDKAKCTNTLYNCFRIIRTLQILMYPYLPNAAEKLIPIFGELKWKSMDVPIGAKLTKPEMLFKKIDT